MSTAPDPIEASASPATVATPMMRLFLHRARRRRANAAHGANAAQRSALVQSFTRRNPVQEG